MGEAEVKQYLKEILGGPDVLLKKINVLATVDSCSICLDKIVTSTTIKLKCRHFFHTTCIKTWLQHNSTCPNCRTLVQKE